MHSERSSPGNKIGKLITLAMLYFKSGIKAFSCNGLLDTGKDRHGKGAGLTHHKTKTNTCSENIMFKGSQQYEANSLHGDAYLQGYEKRKREREREKGIKCKEHRVTEPTQSRTA